MTSVVLPRQKTTKNFVLQTTCRCLREVDDASKEKALIYLSKDNYETLDKELKENYRLSITDLSEKKEQTIKIQIRKPKLGKLKYKQIETKYKIVKKTSPEIKKELADFKFDDIKNRYSYDKTIISGSIGRNGLTGEIAIGEVNAGLDREYSFEDFIYDLSSATYGLLSESELHAKYENEIAEIFSSLSKEIEWIALNPNIKISDVISIIASSFMDRNECKKK